jgi:hypothetical protein
MITTINEFRKLNENNGKGYRMISGYIPSKDKWGKANVSGYAGEEVSTMKINGKEFAIRPDKEEWFEENAGKLVKFKYQSMAFVPYAELPQLMESKAQYNYDIKEVHISQINAGDTVLHNGEMKTVSGTDIKEDKFMGKSIFGDSYKLGHELVKKVIFKTGTGKVWESNRPDAFCPNCDTYIVNQRVTFEETCDTCNTPVEWHDENGNVLEN